MLRKLQTSGSKYASYHRKLILDFLQWPVLREAIKTTAMELTFFEKKITKDLQTTKQEKVIKTTNVFKGQYQLYYWVYVARYVNIQLHTYYTSYTYIFLSSLQKLMLGVMLSIYLIFRKPEPDYVTK